ncbi:MAG: hypothetical protein COT74_01085 [Bdellovibrionales bacterium CG10_big_fil_rev_8_21_14_0_10_45_34]|nr:MAG: hypothetical protein COT74_01085 [Bdellovibrionales bacterium CG10_big_fil_rev_8_21_14_0_10_45_34]
MESDISIHQRHAFETWKLASPQLRVLAKLIDFAICAALAWAFQFFVFKNTDAVHLLPMFVFVCWLWDGIWLSSYGHTPGLIATNLEVYSPRMDGLPSPRQVGMRILGFWLGVFSFGLGLTPILYRKDRRGWGDLLSESVIVGPQKSLPSPLTEKVAWRFVPIQTLAVFGFFGAYLLTAAIRTPEAIKEENPFACTVTQNVVENFNPVLFAIAVSPAWVECWDQTQFNLKNLSDSILYRSYAGARAEWSQPSQSRNPAVTSNQEFFVKLKNATSAQTRITLIEEEIEKPHHPVEISALKDRLWHEKLVAGLLSSQDRPGSSYSLWSEQNVCWAEATGQISSKNCLNSSYSHLVSSFSFSDAPASDPYESLSNMPETAFTSELTKLADFYAAIKEGNDAIIQRQYRVIQEASPVRALASSWYQQVQ